MINKSITPGAFAMKWFIVWPSGRILTADELEPRPNDAAESDDPFAPWYEAREHSHGPDHDWFGSFHVQASTAEEAVAKAIEMEEGRCPT